MRIKNHPRAIVEIYVDGRVSVFFPDNPSNTFRNALKITLIEMATQAVRNNAGKLEPGRYNVVITRLLRVFPRVDAEFELTKIS